MAEVQQLEEQLRSEQQLNRKLTVVPWRHHKVLHLIRHGEGYHNVAGRANHDNYKSWEFEDSHLTEAGWKQAKAVQQHIKAAGIRADVVLVSPLTRALETAVGCFGNLSAPLNGAPPLMAELSGEPGKRAAHPAVSAEGCPPFVCLELCREMLGVHPCDRRRPLSEKMAMFPAVDFSLVEEEEDVLWSEQHRETREEIKARAMRLMAQVMARPETHIAVVTHSSFLHFWMQNFGHGASEAVQADLHRWWENCELRTVVVADELGGAGGAPPDPYHFAGFGASVKEGPEA